MNIIYALIITMFFTGCELFDSNEIKLKKLQAQTQKDMAQIKLEKELANIDKSKELEKVKLQSELEQGNFEQTMQLRQQDNEMRLNIYIALIVALLIIVISSFIYYFFKRRHENELRQYKDNLDKYFHQQENNTRLKIAEKLIDAVASGQLNQEQKTQLVNTFNGQINEQKEQRKQIPLAEEE